MPLRPAREDSLTMHPPPVSLMARISCMRQKKTPLTLVSRVESQSSSVWSISGAMASKPALLNAVDPAVRGDGPVYEGRHVGLDGDVGAHVHRRQPRVRA